MDLSLTNMTKTKKRRVGRPSRKDLGLAPARYVGAKITCDVRDACVVKYGSIGQALRFAAKHNNGQEVAA